MEAEPRHCASPFPLSTDPNPNQARAEAELGAECARRFKADEAHRDAGTATAIEALAEAEAMDTVARRNTALQAGQP